MSENFNINSPGSDYSRPKTTGDLYAAPTTTAKVPSSMTAMQTDDSPWYATTGRIGRVRYLAYSAIWTFLLFIIIAIGLSLSNTAAFLLLFIPLLATWLYSGIIIPRRRLNDLNRSGWFLLLNLLPVIPFLLALYMLFAPGDDGFNDYGQPAAPHTKADVGLAIALPIVILIFMIWVIANSIQAYEEYFEPMGTDKEWTTEDEVSASVDARVAEIEAQRAQELQNGSENPSSAMPAGEVNEAAFDEVNEEGMVSGGNEFSEQPAAPINEPATNGNDATAQNNPRIDNFIETDEDIQQAIDDAIGASPGMSFEEFMDKDRKILVEEE